MRPRRSLTKLLLPIATLAVGGCLATRSDVERMELTLKAMQDSARMRQNRSDSVTRTLIREATAQLAQNFARDFAAVSDSVRGLTANVQKFQGDVSLAIYDLKTQNTVIQEVLGQSNRRMQDIKNSVEANAQGARPTDPATPQQPNAAQLLGMGKRLLLTQATGGARQNFQDLITNYPADERVPEAQFYIAETFSREGNKVGSDSVYALVVLKYPRSDYAASSLYKRAQFAKEAGDNARWEALLRELIARYPKSEAAVVAADLLKPKP